MKIRTVCGDRKPENLGPTLCHEHLHLNYEPFYSNPLIPADVDKRSLPFTLENISWIQKYPYSHSANIRIDDVPGVMEEEMQEFKRNGGDCVVECTTYGIGRNVKFLKELSQKSDVNIVAGSGYYLDTVHPSNMSSRSEESIYDEIRHDVTDGCDGTDIKCGIIGEIGISSPMTVNEKKVLRAAALAQAQLGCALNIHPGRDIESPFEILRVIQEAGVDIRKTVLSHVERTLTERSRLLEFAQCGAFLEFDLFGNEFLWYYARPSVPMATDQKRLEMIRWLLGDDMKYATRILLSHDVHTKHRLRKFGGPGFSHLLNNVLPVFKFYGIDDNLRNTFMVDNPRQMLEF